MNRKPIFDAIKALPDRKCGQPFTMPEVRLIDAAIDAALGGIVTSPPTFPPSSGRRIGPRGIKLMHEFEGCRLETYKDPGSADGLPITGGWGTTLDEHGRPFELGFTASQEYWDERFAADLAKFAARVDALIGTAPTTANQFSAMVSLAYNIGVGAFKKSTVLRKHRAGDYHGAAAAFSMWVKNNGTTMRGLVRRRAAEADLYDDA